MVLQEDWQHRLAIHEGPRGERQQHVSPFGGAFRADHEQGKPGRTPSQHLKQKLEAPTPRFGHLVGTSTSLALWCSICQHSKKGHGSERQWVLMQGCMHGCATEACIGSMYEYLGSRARSWTRLVTWPFWLWSTLTSSVPRLSTSKNCSRGRCQARHAHLADQLVAARY